ncbi:hypothetical protein DL764_010270 [Monosporascus ibericus]|uniref:Uncharacterized protein n=1 Tax=Monosporascus ibericus TaxID=155417 RepID=A0A4Q4ST29_9PEZI|nr:hypothetical protein DL764_010270 [Monosporascus ibericus]
MEKAEKKYQILRRSWRKPDNNSILTPVLVTPSDILDEKDTPDVYDAKPTISTIETTEDKVIIASLTNKLETDPRIERWSKSPLPQEAVPFKNNESNVVTMAALQERKTYDGQKIPFPEDEDPEHVKRVRELLPEPLAHLEGFFSKKEANTLPDFRPGHDVVLELDRPIPASGPPTYRTPV